MDRCKAAAFRTLQDESCNSLETSKEDLGKFALKLLNCQREMEGRPTYECSDDQALRNCTLQMDEVRQQSDWF